MVPTLRTETWQVLETSGPLGVDKPQVGKWQPQIYVTCRVARCWKSPFYHLGSCECTYEAACLVCKKNRHQRAVWIVHSIPQGHSSNTRATGPLPHSATLGLLPRHVSGRPLSAITWCCQVKVAASECWPHSLSKQEKPGSVRGEKHIPCPHFQIAGLYVFLKKIKNKQKKPNTRTCCWLPPILSSQENKRHAWCFHNQRFEQDFPFIRLPTCPNNQATSGMLPV